MSENSKSPLLLVLIALVCVLIVLQQTGWQLLGGQDTQKVVFETEGASGESLVGAIGDETMLKMSVDFADMEALIKALPSVQRARLLENPELFEQMVQQEANFKSLLKGALESGFQDDQSVRLLMERAANRVLAEGYLAVLLNKNVQGKFPTEQEVESFYESNSQQFEMPDLIYLSQIFFSTSEANAEDVMQRANEVYQELVKGKSAFADLARKHSEHGSKDNGGDMGPINLQGMLPEIRAAVQQLEENAISQPIRTQTGIHILRKGGVIKSGKVSLEQAREKIRNSLAKNTQNRVRIAIIEKVTEKYPVNVETTEIDSWRTQLQVVR